MSGQRCAYRLSSAIQLVREDDAWIAYDAAGARTLALDAAELAACLTIAAGGDAEDSGTLHRLSAHGILVRDEEDHAPIDRVSWASRGWSAACDFTLSLYGSSEQAAPARLVKDPGFPGAHGGLVEHYPPAPTAPLCRDVLLSCLREAGFSGASSCLKAVVCAISVEDMAPGWYRGDGSTWPGATAVPSAADLERIAPVAFGRAGYAVQALVIVAAIRPAVELLSSRSYARVLVSGGTAVSRLEGTAYDAGLSCRGNYAVDSSVARWLGITPDELLPVGAVALGGR